MEYSCVDYQSTDLKILIHHIYEYKKGIRNLVLHTMNSFEADKAERLLNQRNIPYFIQKVNDRKINIFFGDIISVKIIKSFNQNSLSDFTDEQDFILGIMLGYSRKQQCERYFKRNRIKSNSILLINELEI